MSGVTTRKRSLLTSEIENKKMNGKLEATAEDANNCDQILKVQLVKEVSTVADEPRTPSRRVTRKSVLLNDKDTNEEPRTPSRRSRRLSEQSSDIVDKKIHSALTNDEPKTPSRRTRRLSEPTNIDDIAIKKVSASITDDPKTPSKRGSKSCIHNVNVPEVIREIVDSPKSEVVEKCSADESTFSNSLIINGNGLNNVESMKESNQKLDDVESMKENNQKLGDKIDCSPNRSTVEIDISPSKEVCSSNTSSTLTESTVAEEDANVLSKELANSSNFRKSLVFQEQNELLERCSTDDDLNSTEKRSTLPSTDEPSPSKGSNEGQESSRKGAESDLIEVCNMVDVGSKTDKEQPTPFESNTSPQKAISHEVNELDGDLGSKDMIEAGKMEATKVSDLEMVDVGSKDLVVTAEKIEASKTNDLEVIDVESKDIIVEAGKIDATKVDDLEINQPGFSPHTLKRDLIVEVEKIEASRVNDLKVIDIGSKDIIVEAEKNYAPKVDNLEVNLPGLSPQKKAYGGDTLVPEDLSKSSSSEKLESKEVIHPKSDLSHQNASCNGQASAEEIESSSNSNDSGPSIMSPKSVEATSKSNNSDSSKKVLLTQTSSVGVKHNTDDRIISKSPQSTEIDSFDPGQPKIDQSPQSENKKLKNPQHKYQLGDLSRLLRDAYNSQVSSIEESSGIGLSPQKKACGGKALVPEDLSESLSSEKLESTAVTHPKSDSSHKNASCNGQASAEEIESSSNSNYSGPSLLSPKSIEATSKSYNSKKALLIQTSCIDDKPNTDNRIISKSPQSEDKKLKNPQQKHQLGNLSKRLWDTDNSQISSIEESSGIGLSPQKKACRGKALVPEDLSESSSSEELESLELTYPKTDFSPQNASCNGQASAGEIESCGNSDSGPSVLPPNSIEATSDSNNSKKALLSQTSSIDDKHNTDNRIISKSPLPTEIDSLDPKQQEIGQSPQSKKKKLKNPQQKHQLGNLSKRLWDPYSSQISSIEESSEITHNLEENSETDYFRISKNELAQLIRGAVDDALGALRNDLSEMKNEIVELKATKRKINVIEESECVSVAKAVDEEEYSAPIKKKKEEIVETLLTQQCVDLFSNLEVEQKKKKKKKHKNRDKPSQLENNINLEEEKTENLNLEPVVHREKSKKRKISEIVEESPEASEAINENQDELNLFSVKKKKKKNKNKADTIVTGNKQLYDLNSHVNNFGCPTFEKDSIPQEEDDDDEQSQLKSIIKSKRRQMKKNTKINAIVDQGEHSLADSKYDLNSDDDDQSQFNSIIKSKKKRQRKKKTKTNTDTIFDLTEHSSTDPKYDLNSDDDDDQSQSKSIIKSKKKRQRKKKTKTNTDTIVDLTEHSLTDTLVQKKKEFLEKRDELKPKIKNFITVGGQALISSDANKSQRPSSNNKSKGAKSYSPNTFKLNILKKKLKKTNKKTEDSSYKLTPISSLNENILKWD